MAAAAIGIALPLITEFGPKLIDLITGLVHKSAPVAQTNYGTGTGPVKFGDVFAYVTTALTSAAAAGQIPKQLPSEEILKVTIQAVVTSMKLSGLLGPLDPSAVIGQPGASGQAGAAQTIILKAGQSLTFSVV